MRNNDISLMTSAELAIYNAMQEVEKLGADTRLSNAVVYLMQAKAEVSYFIDQQIKEELCK